MRATVEDWLTVLGEAQQRQWRDTAAALAERTAVLAVLRGALLDLLATGNRDRTTAAVRQQPAALSTQGDYPGLG